MDENIKTDVLYTSALNNGLMGLKEIKIPLLNTIKPTAPTTLTISDQKKAELKALAEKDQRKKNRKAYWHISKNEWANAAPNLLQAGIDAIPGLISGIMDNDYSNALASFTPSEKPEMNPVDLAGKLDGKPLAVPGQLPSSKQGGQINYINLFK